MNSQKTKKKLTGSVIALIVCFAMLLGTTFAWFTDTASTSVNTIQSGKLNVDIEKQVGDKWESVDGKTLKFVDKDGSELENVLWEPGCTYKLPTVRIANNGNLALKYKAVFNLSKDDDAELAEVIDVQINGETICQLNAVLDSTDADGFAHGNLRADENSGALAISLHMQESAGNAYQNKCINGISITVVATQDTVEYDSTTNEYDKDATYEEVVKNANEFKAALESNAVSTIVIAKDITYDWGGKSYENAENLVMQGKTIKGSTGNETITFAGYGSANNIKDVTLENLKVIDKTKGDDESAWEHGYLEFDNLVAKKVNFVDQIQLNGTCSLNACTLNGTKDQYAAWVNSGNVSFEDCTVQGKRSIKVHEAYGSDVESVLVDNCTFTTSAKPGVVIGTVDSTTKITIKNSTFTGVPAGDQGKYFYESDTNVGSFEFTETNNTHN